MREPAAGRGGVLGRGGAKRAEPGGRAGRGMLARLD